MTPKHNFEYITIEPEWEGETCFIICGGESVRAQEHLIPKLPGRIIAVKQSVTLRPDADVMFISGKDDPRVCKPFFSMFTGKYLIGRGPYEGAPSHMRVIRRTKIHDRLCKLPDHVAGFDGGTSAINLAYHFGSREIVMLGYDMTGGRWLNDRMKHHLPIPPENHHVTHMSAARTISKDLEAEGVKVWNASKISKATFFEKRSLESFL